MLVPSLFVFPPIKGGGQWWRQRKGIRVGENPAKVRGRACRCGQGVARGPGERPDRDTP